MSSSTSPLPIQSGNLLVVGSVNADTFIEIDRMPVLGETISASRPDTGIVMPGGKGANQAVCASRLCAPNFRTYFLCRFGNDSHPNMLRRVMAEENPLDLSLCSTTDKSPSGQAFIFLDKQGNNSIILVGGANHDWPSYTAAELQKIYSDNKISMIMLQREIPEAVNLQVAQAAHAVNIPVMLDMGGEATSVSNELLSCLYLLSANETELARLSGLPTDTDAEVLVAAKEVQKRGVKILLITLGSRGARLILPDGQVIEEPARKVEKIVDTTGAGDTFRGAFTVAYMRSSDKGTWNEYLRYASAAASICITRKGAMPSLPSKQEVDELLSK